jgi:hypothetical protein
MTLAGRESIEPARFLWRKFSPKPIVAAALLSKRKFAHVEPVA